MKMKTRQIGTAFEKEAYEILKTKFDEVEWLSYGKNSSLDFKCKKDGEVYYGDAKFITDFRGRPTLRHTQKDADFVILKRAGKVSMIWKEDFLGKVYIDGEDQTTIQVRGDTWTRLQRRKAYPSQTFDTIINNLIDQKNDKTK